MLVKQLSFKQSTHQNKETSVITFPQIDYANHPAFQPYLADHLENDGKFDALQTQIDRCLTEIRGEKLTNYQSERNFRANIDPLFEKLIELSYSTTHEYGDLSSVLRSALIETRNRLLAQLKYNYERDEYRGSSELGTPLEITRTFKESGIYKIKLSPDTLMKLRESTHQYRQHVRDLREKNTRGRCDISLPVSGKHWEIIKDILRQSGLQQGLSDCFQHHLTPIYCALALGHERQIWWKDVYSDVGIPTSPLAYLHTDDDFDLSKVIIYLDDVGPEQGPFCYLKDSQLWTRHSETQFNLMKSMDQCCIRFWSKHWPKHEDLYRARFRIPEFRRLMMRMPSVFRGSSHFGDDILEGSHLAIQLKKQEVKVLSSEFNCFAFEGGRLLHRGGLVERGERWAIQIALHDGRIEELNWRQLYFRRLSIVGRKLLGDRTFERLKSKSVGSF